MLLNHTFNSSEAGGSVEGRYANVFKIGHNAYEFIIDCGQNYSSGAEKANLHTRIITSPVYAKALMVTLIDTVDEYERVYGPISD